MAAELGGAPRQDSLRLHWARASELWEAPPAPKGAFKDPKNTPPLFGPKNLDAGLSEFGNMVFRDRGVI